MRYKQTTDDTSYSRLDLTVGQKAGNGDVDIRQIRIAVRYLVVDIKSFQLKCFVK